MHTLIELGFAKRRMRSSKRVLYTVGILAIPVLLAAWLASTWLLATRIPSRPKLIDRSAVFLWAPAVGFPGGLPRRGWWLNCWEEAGRDRCKLSDISGRTEYEGEFVTYRGRRSVAEDELRIDAAGTADQKVWVGNILVPLVHLDNGQVLIPTAAYDQAVRLLNQSNSQSKR